ncbi:hypothetical protein PTI98_000241 [Pleurotus ostreatus]|nr:hypothetical protein PTI98_000241 [Pleurotus ostreatus]
MVFALFQLLSVLPLIAFGEPVEHRTRAFARGNWTLTQEGTTGVSAMQLTVVSDTKAIVFDKIEHNPLLVNGHPAWASEIDLPSRTIRPLNPLSNTFCGTGSFLSNGTFVHSAGNPIEIEVGAPYAISGLQSVRLFTPCNDGSCDIIENPNRLRLATKRWYTASTRLEDGSVLIFGGSVIGGFINNASVNNPTFEFFPPKNIHGFNGLQIPSKFLVDTLIANQFPTVMSLPDGNLFVVANQEAMLFNWKTNRETRLPRLPNGIRISYPFSGGVVMLPLTIENNFTPEILTCGGAAISDALPDIEYSSQSPASTQCARMVLNKAGIASGWKVEHMPQPWTMVELVLLPDRRVLLVNGMRSGVSGFNSVHDPVGQSNADHPNFTPFIYDPNAPAGRRFSSAGVTSKIARMYHSTATVIPDGSILIGTSDSHHNSKLWRHVLHLQRDQIPMPISWLTPRSHLNTEWSSCLLLICLRIVRRSGASRLSSTTAKPSRWISPCPLRPRGLQVCPSLRIVGHAVAHYARPVSCLDGLRLRYAYRSHGPEICRNEIYTISR